MKNLFLALALFTFTGAFSQCTISGADQIKVGEIQSYSADNSVAQCEDCHLWAMERGAATLSGLVKKKTITVKGLAPGQANLGVTVVTADGEVKCSKTIDVTENQLGETTEEVGNPLIGEVKPQGQSSGCDVDFSEFAEVKNSDEMVSFVPLNTDKQYKYEWTAVYVNGDQKIKTAKNPSFIYSKGNGIIHLTLVVTSASCTRTIQKRYQPNFWMFF